jgi:hypothetical protein
VRHNIETNQGWRARQRVLPALPEIKPHHDWIFEKYLVIGMTKRDKGDIFA